MPLPPNRRGRPRSFDPATALRPITGVFWTKGFDATSVDDLAQAAGLNKPNLYGAFGDKRAMYRTALGGFRGQLTLALESTLSGAGPLADELGAFFDTAIGVYTAGDAALGCMIMCTAPVASVDDPGLRDFVQEVISQLDSAFRARLETAVAAGELPVGAPLAPLLTALLQSVAIRARAGASAVELRGLTRETVLWLVGSPADRRPGGPA